jgi:type IV pilus assembly protein PilW
MNRPQHRPAHQGGFSLVELLVSMTLGLVMLGALVALFGTSLQTNSQTSTSAQMTEEGGLALEFLARYVRMAGFSPPLVNASGATVLVNGIQTQATESHFVGAGVKGCDTGFVDASAAWGSLSCKASGSTAIALRFQGDLANTEPSSANKPTDCLAQAITTTTTSDYDETQQVTLVESRFTVNDRAELVCGGNGNRFIAQPLFSNIEGLRLRYGIAADGRATQVLRYVDAATVDGLTLDAAIIDETKKANLRWARVVSVKICMLVRASTPDQSQPVPYVDCDEQTITPTDKYLRRSISTVVTLRNRSALIQ